MNKEQTIDLSPPQNKILQKILRQQIPNKTVWAFGSRVEWKASETSDLDLVAHKCSGMEIADLKEALEESALHCSVDVLNWEDIPDSFRANIKKHYVVVQQNTVPEGWRVVKLGDMVEEIVMGQSPKSETYNTTKDGMPFYQGVVDFGDRFVTPRIYCSAPKKVINAGTILLSVRAPVGRVNLTREQCSIGRGNCGLRTDKNNQIFLFYLLKASEAQFESSASGTIFSSVSGGDIKGIEILLPPLSEQKAIAEVLSSLDDKIDLLRKQNKTLEDMAQTLFCKWFMEDAGDDWEKAKLSDEFDIIMGQSPPGHTYNRDSIGMPLFQGNADFQFRFPNDRVYTTAPHRTAQKFDTLVSVRAPVGKQNMARKECCIGRGVAAFRYKKDNTCHTYTYYKINSMLSEIKQYNSTGTVFGAIAKNDFASIYTTLPPDASIQSFEDMAKPIDEKILLNDNQVHTLEKLRDVLLPKLMSGKIRAKH